MKKDYLTLRTRHSFVCVWGWRIAIGQFAWPVPKTGSRMVNPHVPPLDKTLINIKRTKERDEWCKRTGRPSPGVSKSYTERQRWVLALLWMCECVSEIWSLGTSINFYGWMDIRNFAGLAKISEGEAISFVNKEDSDPLLLKVLILG